MFKNAKTTVQQGTVGLAAAVFQYQKLGYNVSIPLVDNQSYDLVIELHGVLQTVQVKTTRFQKGGTYIVQLKSVRPNKTVNTIHNFDNSSCDVLFVLSDSGDCYSIPTAEISTKTELRLNDKVEAYMLD